MQMELLNIAQMILIGSTGRNSGKTTLAAELIKKWKDKFPIIALKVTTVEYKNGKYITDGHGCSVCTSIKGNFELIEELDKTNTKDTSLLLTSGATKVYWLKCLDTHILDGIKFFIDQVPKDALIICESNTLRNVVIPGSFIMLKNINNNTIKPSANRVIDNADIIVENDFQNSIKTLIEKIKIEKNESNFIIKIF